MIKHFYIATSLSNINAHHIVRDALKAYGHEITYDWALHNETHLKTEERLQEIAMLELNGISDSHFVIVLLPGGKGTHIELGYAIASRKKVFIHGSDSGLFEIGSKTTAFYYHPEINRLNSPLSDVAPTVHSLLNPKPH